MGADIKEALHLLASDKTGAEWDVVVIAEGKSLNGTIYPEDTLRAAVQMFEGVPVCAYQFSDPEVPFDHLPDDVREKTKGESPILNAVGTIEACRYGEYVDKQTGQKRSGILARLKIGEGFERLRGWMKNAWDSGLNSFGFSIDGAGDVSSDGTVSHLESISELTLVTRPAAGGSGVRLVASQTEDLMNKDKILALLREHAPDLLKDCDVADLKESDVLDLLGKAVSVAKVAAKEEAPPAAPEAPAAPSIDAMLANMTPEELKALAEKLAALLTQGEAPAEAPVAASVTEGLKSLQAQVADILSGASIDDALSGSKLEDISKARVRESFAGKTPTSDEVASAIKAEAEYVDKLTESGKVAGMGVEVGTERTDKLRLAMDLSFGNRLSEADRKTVTSQGIRQFISISHMIEEMEGGKPLRSVREAYAAKGRRLHEGLVTGDWTDIFRDAMNMSFIQEYARTDDYNIEDLKQVAKFVPISNLHTQYAITAGGFANLSSVSQGETYPEISMYGDLAETYTPSKYGGVVEITEETLKQDDLGALTDIPKKLGKSARRTLYEFGFDMFDTNAAFAQDSVAWFHSSSHGANLLTTAVSQAAILAASLVVRKQAEDDSSKRLGLTARLILCPLDLEGPINALVRASGEAGTYDHETDPNVIRQIPEGNAWRVIPVTHWTDANNWYLVCEMAIAETIRIGFVDGKEEPEIYIQDDPKFGARFSADKIQYKIRHWYGGAPVDYRTAVRHTVT